MMTDREKTGLKVLAARLDIADLADLRNNAEVERLFELSIGRVFLKDTRVHDVRTGRPRPDTYRTFEKLSWYWHSTVDAYYDRYSNALIHIVDWLWTASMESHPWVRDVDALGRPKKIMKCGSIQRLMHEADKAERRLQRQPLPHFLTLTASDERHELDLGAGYSLVRLLTTEALDVEGADMHHCIGRGSYDEDLLVGGHEFYSIRDEEGQRRATIQIVPREIDGVQYGQVRQFVGFANAVPDPHIIDLVQGVMMSMGWIEKPRTKHETSPQVAAAF